MDIIDEGLRNPPEIGDFGAAFNDPKIISRAQSQSARKNPAWKKSLVSSMRKYGFELVGAGFNGAVFQNPNYPFVIKVYRKDEGYDEWLHFSRTHSSNRFVPKFRGETIIVNDIFRAVRLEPLISCPNESACDFIDMVEQVKNISWNRSTELPDDHDLVEVSSFMREWEQASDLTPHNVMCRADGQVVIIDPVCISPGQILDW